MSKQKLVDDIKRNPARFHRVPSDVVRDRRFTDSERLEILKAWQDATQGAGNAEQIGAVQEARQQIGKKGSPANATTPQPARNA